jgi:hypothetical protein
MTSNSYPTDSRSWFFHDIVPEEHHLERLRFHLKTGDYFPLLATILGFLEETVKECDCSAEAELAPMEARVIETVRKDLAYLNKNYHIVPKTHDAKTD